MTKHKFGKKLLGDKIRTQMVYHRIVFKAYQNGITIKPLGSQGNVWCPAQEEIFLTNENAEFLLQFLQTCDSANKIVESLDKAKEEEKRFEDEFGRSARYS